MTNILKLVLNKKESKIIQIIVGYYKIAITEEIFNKALQENQLDFFYYIFSFGKNFIYDKKEKKSTQITYKIFL